MASKNELRRTTVLGLLMEQFEPGYFVRFLADFGGVAYEKLAAIEFRDGNKLMALVTHEAKERLKLPGCCPEESKQRVVVIRIQEEPPDHAADKCNPGKRPRVAYSSTSGCGLWWGCFICSALSTKERQYPMKLAHASPPRASSA